MRIISQDGTIDVPYEHTTLINVCGEKHFSISKR